MQHFTFHRYLKIRTILLRIHILNTMQVKYLDDSIFCLNLYEVYFILNTCKYLLYYHIDYVKHKEQA